MDNVREILRGAAAPLTAFAVMGVLAACALSLMSTPVTWPFVAAVLAAAVGGPASMAGQLDTGQVPAVVHGTVGIVPLGVALPGAVVFCVLFAGAVRVPMRSLALRAAGAAGAMGAALIAVLAAGAATVRVSVPVGNTGTMRETVLVLRPDAGATVLGGSVALIVLIGFCVLLTLLPARRVVARVALLGPLVPIAVALAVASFVAAQRPAVAGVAVLFGVNAVLAAVLAAFGAPPPAVLGGPLSEPLRTGAGGHEWLLGGAAGPVAVRLAVLTAFVLLGAVLLAVAPGPGSGRWQRAGLRGLIAGTTLALVFAGMAVAGAGSLRLGVAVLVFDVPVLDLRVAAGVWWALLAGAAGGGLAGVLGSLVADARAPLPAVTAAPVPVAVPQTVPGAGQSTSERG
ncbi:hypothetical protein [Actinoplanes sp. GCM10030250]|uniref:hypothetical protein n=1 Tax=Actinoplanes sp. GCM10030250 TaxID=3273376 RepID=UPI00360CD36A